jgi:hypothetical protein
MSQKIKSITIIKDFPSNNLPFLKYEGKELESRIDPDGKFMSWDIENYPEFFQIEYEPEKPTLLKRPDGSLISEFEELQKVIKIENCNNEIHVRECSFFKGCDLISLKQGLIFLKEDIDLAEKKAKQLTKKRDIQYVIDRLEAMSSREDLNSVFTYYNGRDKVFTLEVDLHNDPIYSPLKMITRTGQRVLEALTYDEYKQYLGMVL